MTIRGDLEGMLRPYMTNDEAFNIAWSFFDSLTCGDAISYLQTRGIDAGEMASFCYSVGLLKAKMLTRLDKKP